MSQKYFYVNSKYRLNGSTSTSDFLYNIPSHGQYKYCFVSDIVIPKSYYLIEPGETFLCNGNSITLNIGNYDVLSLMAEISNELNISSGLTFTITYSSLLNKYTFTGSAPFTFIFNTVNDVAEHLGFNYGTTTSSAGNILTSTNMCKTVRDDIFYILCDQVDNYNNVLSEIYSANTYALSYLEEQTNMTRETQQKRIIENAGDVWHFSLVNDMYQPINLNGITMGFTLILVNEKIDYNKKIYDLLFEMNDNIRKLIGNMSQERQSDFYYVDPDAHNINERPLPKE